LGQHHAAGGPTLRRAIRAPTELLTPRLLLRQWRDDDLERLVAINSDPEVTEFLHGPFDAATTARFIERARAHWEQHGFGRFALESRESQGRGELVGFTGVAYPTFLPAVAHRPELGWRLDRRVWGRGLATEAAVACRSLARDHLRLDELISIIHPDNHRSQRVAEKLGMAVEGQVEDPVVRRPVDVWAIDLRAGASLSPGRRSTG
jgi:RimJ/RimL family protein N-acetyltransferase